MASQKEIKDTRLKKLKELQKESNPYPAKVKRSHTNLQALQSFDKLSSDKTEVSLVGRIISFREHGASTFVHIKDSSSKIQLYFKKNEIGDKEYKKFLSLFDIGDFIEAQGQLFKTKKEEKTLLVHKFKIACKSLLPLPEKWHGLKDVEERYRKRYLDLLMNEDIKQKFETRSHIIKAIRQFLEQKEFIEVETPILQNLYGGALAEPFVTHLNALNQDLYLRIAPELYLKRLLVGGFEKVYEIGRCFRNEGIDSHHNPDFTLFEFYWAYADNNDLMSFTEDLIEYILKAIGIKDQKITYQGKDIEIKKPFDRIDFAELGKNDDEVKEKIKNILKPTFIINHPVEMSPLAKQLDDDKSKVARNQLILAGSELTNCYSELNDPQLQAQRFKEQQKQREKGSKETQPYDQDYIEALEYGMPPAGGFGMGLDRLSAILTDSHSLREVILFPTMKLKK